MIARAFRREDAAGCLAVFDSNLPDFFSEAERAPFAAFLEALPGPYLVLEDEAGSVVGCGGYAIEEDGRTAALCWGMVMRSLHGSGLGRLLVEERLDRIRQEERATAAILNTSQHTRAFYERFGFVTERVIPDGFGPGLHRCDLRLLLSSHP